MVEVIKNMFRRKVRTLLTVFGITIGILALVVMGAMAEKITRLVEGGTKYYSDKVIVSAKGGFAGFGSSPLSIDKKEEIKMVEGVEVVSATIMTTLDDEIEGVSFGPVTSIIGTDLDERGYESFEITLRDGRLIEKGDRNKVVLGSDTVKIFNDAKVGGEVTIRGEDYEVVGIYEATLTAPDSTVEIPLYNAQRIVYKNLPEIVKNTTSADDIATSFAVYFKEGYDPDEMADVIAKEVDEITAMGPAGFEDQIGSAVSTLTSIIYGIAFMSLLIGSLSVINTMTMSISERTKEIGVKKAIGAKTKNILAEYLAEAGMIGFLGGLTGIILGSSLVLIINKIMEESGDKIFLLTPRLLISSLTFSIVLGIVAGIYPAYHAARLSIVKSLREE